MFWLIVVLIFLFVVITLLLSAWTAWYSSYLYEQPTGDLQWRGPVAGAVVMVGILVWVMLAYRSPESYRALWEFSSREVSAPFKDLTVTIAEKGEPERYRLIAGTRQEYRLNGMANMRPMPSRPLTIEVKEGDQVSVFKPERDSKGKLLIRKNESMFASQAEPLRYIDESGRVMLEDSLGQITTFKTGNFVMNVLLNLFMLAVWFAALWPVLRFQWTHALGQAVILWLVTMLFVMPPVLNVVESASRAASAPVSK